MQIADSKRINVKFGGLRLSALQALAVLALRDLELRPHAVDVDFATLATAWRRRCAGNLAWAEWARKAWANVKAYKNLGDVLVVLADLRLIVARSRLCLTDSGRACAAALSREFDSAMDPRTFTTYCRTTHTKVTGRIE